MYATAHARKEETGGERSLKVPGSVPPVAFVDGAGFDLCESCAKDAMEGPELFRPVARRLVRTYACCSGCLADIE